MDSAVVVRPTDSDWSVAGGLPEEAPFADLGEREVRHDEGEEDRVEDQWQRRETEQPGERGERKDGADEGHRDRGDGDGPCGPCLLYTSDAADE